MTHYIKKIYEKKLAFIILYTEQNVYFTGNPNYTLFGFPISHDRDLKVCEYEYMIDNFSKKYRHTNFYTDTDKILIKDTINLNDFDYDIIYDLILETKVIPSNIILNIYRNSYDFSISNDDIIYFDNKTNTFYVKIPLHMHSIKFLILLNRIIDNTIQIISPTNNIDNILHFRYAYLDIDERKLTMDSVIKNTYEYNKYIIKNDDYQNNILQIPLKKIIDSNNGEHIIKNCIITNIIIETDEIPEFIDIELDLIKEKITKEELLFYNNIYENITTMNNKIQIKFPILFNKKIILFDTLELKIKTNIKSKLIYEYQLIYNSLKNDIIKNPDRFYDVVKYFCHKNIIIDNDFNISLEDFTFPLKELWFDIRIPENKDCLLYHPELGYFKFEKSHLQILNHLFGFKKICNNYNLISFCTKNKRDFTGEVILDSKWSIHIPYEIPENITNVDVYGIGYKIIQYKYINDRLTCYYKFNEKK